MDASLLSDLSQYVDASKMFDESEGRWTEWDRQMYERFMAYRMQRAQHSGLDGCEAETAKDDVPVTHRWIRVEEELPRHLRCVLAWVIKSPEHVTDDGGFASVACYNASKSCWQMADGPGDIVVEVSHWLSIPPLDVAPEDVTGFRANVYGWHENRPVSDNVLPNAASDEARAGAEREAVLDAADEWARFVTEDHAPMTLRKYLERAIDRARKP